MDSQVVLNPGLDEEIVRYGEGVNPHRVFLESKLLLVDGQDWGVDLDLIRQGLIAKRRKFKAPFKEGTTTTAVSAEIAKLNRSADRFFRGLYPLFNPSERRDSWRPMITGPEPLHFDTYPDALPFVTAFINVAKTPRVYQISYSFSALCARFPREMKQVAADCKGNLDDLSYQVRRRTVRGQPPLGNEAPRHRIEFAPGAAWFFDARMVSHEVIHGEGACGYAWAVPGCGVRMQRDFINQKRETEC